MSLLSYVHATLHYNSPNWIVYKHHLWHRNEKTQPEIVFI